MKLAEVPVLVTDPETDHYIEELVGAIGKCNLEILSADQLEEKIRYELTNVGLYGLGFVSLIIFAAADLKYAQLNPHFWENKVLNSILIGGDVVALLGGFTFFLNGIKTAKQVEEWEKQLDELKYFKLQRFDKV